MVWNNQYITRRKTPNGLSIYTYWAADGKLPPVKGNDYSIPLEQSACFACGLFYGLQRSHIIPLCEKGPNVVENIHILCKGCHSTSEGSKKYWIWLTNMRKNEWKFKWEWVIKLLEMNGVDVNEEAKKREQLPWEEYKESLRKLLEDNGLKLIDKIA